MQRGSRPRAKNNNKADSKKGSSHASQQIVNINLGDLIESAAELPKPSSVTKRKTKRKDAPVKAAEKQEPMKKKKMKEKAKPVVKKEVDAASDRMRLLQEFRAVVLAYQEALKDVPTSLLTPDVADIPDRLLTPSSAEEIREAIQWLKRATERLRLLKVSDMGVKRTGISMPSTPFAPRPGFLPGGAPPMQRIYRASGEPYIASQLQERIAQLEKELKEKEGRIPAKPPKPDVPSKPDVPPKPAEPAKPDVRPKPDGERRDELVPIDPDKEDAIVPVSPDPPNPSKDYQTIKKKLEDLVKEAEKAFKDVSETQILKEEEGYSGITRALAALQVRFMLYIATIKREIQNNPNLSEDEKKVLFEMSNSVQRRITVDNFWTIAKDVAYKQFKPPAPSAEGNQAIETVSQRALGIQTNDQANQGILRNLAFGLLRNQDLATLGTGAVLTGLGGVPPDRAAEISTAIGPFLGQFLQTSANALATWLSSEGMPQSQKELLLGRQLMLEAIEQALRNIPDEYQPKTNESNRAQRRIIEDIRNMKAEILGTRAALFPGELSEDQLEYYLRLFPIELSTFNQSNLLEYRERFKRSSAPLNEEQTARLNQDVYQVLGVARAYRILKDAIGTISPFPELRNDSDLSLLKTSGRRDSDKFMVYQDQTPLDNTPSPMMFDQYGNNIKVDDSEQFRELPDAQVPEEEQKKLNLEIPPVPHPRCSDYSEHTKLCSSVGDGIRTMCVRPDDNCAESRERWNLRGLANRTKQPRPRSDDRGSIEGQPEVVDLGGGLDPDLFPSFWP